MTKERLEALRAKANSERSGWVTQREVTELFAEIDSLRAHNQTLADELNDWRDKASSWQHAADDLAALRHEIDWHREPCPNHKYVRLLPWEGCSVCANST